MGFDEGQIILDSANGAYFTGQTIYGRVVFDQDKEKTIHGIYVDVKGFCKVHWTSQESRRVNDRTEHYTVTHESHEEYFRNKTYIYGNASGEHHLQPGHHEFRFESLIPVNCPSSFEGSNGHVRYRVKVVMHTSGIFSMNKDKMVPIRVIAPVDLNQNPFCKEPIVFDLTSSYCCWCVSAGTSEISVRLPVGGYCPGQVIPMEVACKNTSNVEIDTIKFQIKKNVQYLAISAPGTRNEYDTIAEIKKGPIPARTTRNWTVEMEVPAMEIYNLNACRFIDIDYKFKVSTEVSGCHEDTEEVSAIVFGNVPLVGFQDNIQNPLHDQMPQTMQVQNVQSNAYPPPPIMNQPLPQQPYPNGNQYPNSSPYPSNTPYPTTPNLGANRPYPNASPYPPTQPYPGANPPYPAGTSQPGVPYPAGNTPQTGSPYPGGNLPGVPYPSGTPQSGTAYPTNTPYSTDNPGSNLSPMPPYPGGRQSPIPPYPNVTGTTLLKTGNIGFTAQGNEDPSSMPLLPPGANVPYPSSPPSNPYATASAPEPSTPGSGEKKPGLEVLPDTNTNSPYNPEFMNNKTN